MKIRSAALVPLTLLVAVIVLVPVGATAPTERQGSVRTPQTEAELLLVAKEALAQRAKTNAIDLGAEVEPVTATTGAVRWLTQRVRKDWLEFGDSVRLPTALDFQSSSAVEKLGALLNDRYSSASLSKPIISLGATRAALGTCNAALKVEVKTLQPPHFNNDTGIRWYPDQGKLALESTTVIDMAQNRCVRGIVNLNDGQVSCTELACVIR